MHKKNLLQNDSYENLDNFSNLSLDILKEFSGAICSVFFPI